MTSTASTMAAARLCTISSSLKSTLPPGQRLANVRASEESARKAWDALLGRANEGIRKDGRVDVEGTRTVLKLRSEFGEPRKELTDPSKYIDESYYIKATSRP